MVARVNTISQPMLLGKRIAGVLMGEGVIKTFIPHLINLNKLGRFPYDKLISFYKFEEINEAFEDTHSGKTIKAVLKM